MFFSTTKILNAHKFDRANIGDQSSNILDYFNFGCSAKKVDICNARKLNLNVKAIIIGGGGLLYFKDSFEYLCTHTKAKLIGWGFGVNDHQSKNISYPPFVNLLDLCGVRDWGTSYRWVPCPSCMHPLFDQPYNKIHDIVVYEHKDMPLNLDFPTVTNATSLKTAIKHLASADTVLTNTYHGMYWSVLLRRKVIVFPFSNRFYGMKYKIPLCEKANWKSALKSATTFDEALAECRYANNSFYEDVMLQLNV